MFRPQQIMLLKSLVMEKTTYESQFWLTDLTRTNTGLWENFSLICTYTNYTTGCKNIQNITLISNKFINLSIAKYLLNLKLI